MLDSFLLVASTLSIATLIVTLALVREVRWRRALQKLVSRLLNSAAALGIAVCAGRRGPAHWA